MFDWKQIDADHAAHRAHREGYRSTSYTGAECKHCGRNRVMICANGKFICEKCGWDQEANEYSDYLDI